MYVLFGYVFWKGFKWSGDVVSLWLGKVVLIVIVWRVGGVGIVS